MNYKSPTLCKCARRAGRQRINKRSVRNVYVVILRVGVYLVMNPGCNFSIFSYDFITIVLFSMNLLVCCKGRASTAGLFTDAFLVTLAFKLMTYKLIQLLTRSPQNSYVFGQLSWIVFPRKH